LASDRFAVWLATDKDKEDSEITFGAASDDRIASSETAWLKLSTYKTGMWQVALKDVSAAGQPLNICGEKGCQVAFDTGSSVIGGPAAVIEATLLALGVREDCSNFDQLPMLGFMLGDWTMHLEPTDYVERSSEGCFHRLMTVDVPPPKGPLVLLGAPFLRRYYTVFDRDALQVGVAVAKHAGEARSGESSEQAAQRLMVKPAKNSDSLPAAKSSPMGAFGSIGDSFHARLQTLTSDTGAAADE